MKNLTVGSKVQVKQDLNLGENTVFSELMAIQRLQGQVVTISEAKSRSFGVGYRIKELSGRFFWTSDMFEGVQHG